MQEKPQIIDFSSLETDYSIHETPKNVLNIKIRGKKEGDKFLEIIQPNTKIELKGAGDRYNGVYTVANVSHRVNKGRYSTAFTLRK